MSQPLLPELAAAVDRIRRHLAGRAIEIEADAIEFGARLRLSDAAGRRGQGNLYFSRKKTEFSLHLPAGLPEELAGPLREACAAVCPARLSRAPTVGPNAAAPVSGLPAIDRHLAQVLPKLNAAGFFPEAMEPVAYGLRLTLARGEERLIATFYHSAKKGLSLVLGGRPGRAAAAEVTALAGPLSAPAGGQEERALAAWIGTDEAGKGDYFGPLVAAGVRVDRQLAGELAGLGVTDSKRLADRALLDLAGRLEHRLGQQAAVVEIGPARYNELYPEYAARGSRLNGLLAWAHGRVVRDLAERGLAFEAVVVDRFADPAVIRRALPAGVRLIARERAEDNPAVAAASILARARYLARLAALSAELGIELRPGAGPPALAAGRRLVARHGPEVLARAAKQHFKTTAEILQQLLP